MLTENDKELQQRHTATSYSDSSYNQNMDAAAVAKIYR